MKTGNLPQNGENYNNVEIWYGTAFEIKGFELLSSCLILLLYLVVYEYELFLPTRLSARCGSYRRREVVAIFYAVRIYPTTQALYFFPFQILTTG